MMPDADFIDAELIHYVHGAHTADVDRTYGVDVKQLVLATSSVATAFTVAVEEAVEFSS